MESLPSQSWFTSNAKLAISICLILFAIIIVVIIVFAVLFVLYVPRDMFDRGSTVEKKVIKKEEEPAPTDSIDALEKDFADLDKELINEKNKLLSEDLKSRHFEDDEAQGVECSEEQSSVDAIIELSDEKSLNNISEIEL